MQCKTRIVRSVTSNLYPLSEQPRKPTFSNPRLSILSLFSSAVDACLPLPTSLPSLGLSYVVYYASARLYFCFSFFLYEKKANVKYSRERTRVPTHYMTRTCTRIARSLSKKSTCGAIEVKRTVETIIGHEVTAAATQYTPCPPPAAST